ncbi:MAG: ABC transporter substrate-binding protein [Prevotella sp.]|nr:ABC transporter substrate-binding protein [Prevotella sp.]
MVVLSRGIVMRKTAVLALVAVVLSVVCACRKGQEAGSADTGDTLRQDTSIRIAYVPALDALPFFVAAERGLFAAEGLSVELDSYSADLDIDTALAGGSADGAFTDLVRTAQLRRKDSLRLELLTGTERQWRLFTSRSARLNRLVQFGDKIVAMTRFSATDYLTDRTFAGVKTSAPVFKVQINDVELRLRMLQNNELDAAWLPEPYATRAVMMGQKEIPGAGGKNGRKLGVLALRKAFADRKENAGAAEKLCRVYSMACDTINKYGLRGCSRELMKYCLLDSAAINRLPEITFVRAGRPADELINETRNYLNE